jgi:hypothetical protein
MEVLMRRFLTVSAALLLVLGVDSPNEAPPSATPAAIPDSPEKRLALERLRSQPLVFVENLGQWDEPVRFAGLHGGAGAWLLRDAIAIQLVRRESEELDSPVQCANVRLTFEGARPEARLVGRDQTPTLYNFFLGNDPARWRMGVRGYASVLYVGLYPGVDVLVREGDSNLEYDLVLAPGADLSAVTVRVEGAASPLRLDGESALVAETILGAVRQPRPRAWEETARGPRPVECFYELLGPDRFRFRASRVEEGASLVIDPQLLYSTYLGGSGFDSAWALTLDSSGAAVVA